MSSLELDAIFHHGPECSPSSFGCSLGHLGALLKYGSELPLFILEDDVRTTDHYRRVFDVPTDTDMVYLGCSSYGTSPDYPRARNGFLLSEPLDDEFLRILSMTSQHAILYLTPESVQTAIDAILVAVCATHLAADVELSRLLPKINAIAPRSVFFYQAADQQSTAEKAHYQELLTLITPDTPFLSDVVEVDDPQRGKLRFGIRRNEAGLNEWRLI